MDFSKVYHLTKLPVNWNAMQGCSVIGSTDELMKIPFEVCDINNLLLSTLKYKHNTVITTIFIKNILSIFLFMVLLKISILLSAWLNFCHCPDLP